MYNGVSICCPISPSFSSFIMFLMDDTIVTVGASVRLVPHTYSFGVDLMKPFPQSLNQIKQHYFSPAPYFI